MTPETKTHIYHAVVKSTITYAGETWCLKAKTVSKLNCTEMDFWRRSARIFRKNKIRNTIIKQKSRRMRWAGHVARMGEERNVYRVLVGKPEGRRPLGRPRLRWVDNIRMDLQEVGCGYMGSIGLAQNEDRWRTLVSAVMNLRVREMRVIS